MVAAPAFLTFEHRSALQSAGDVSSPASTKLAVPAAEEPNTIGLGGSFAVGAAVGCAARVDRR